MGSKGTSGQVILVPDKSQVSLKVIKVKLLSHPRVVGVRYGRYLSRAEGVASIYFGFIV